VIAFCRYMRLFVIEALDLIHDLLTQLWRIACRLLYTKSLPCSSEKILCESSVVVFAPPPTLLKNIVSSTPCITRISIVYSSWILIGLCVIIELNLMKL